MKTPRTSGASSSWQGFTPAGASVARMARPSGVNTSRPMPFLTIMARSSKSV